MLSLVNSLRMRVIYLPFYLLYMYLGMFLSPLSKAMGWASMMGRVSVINRAS